MRCRNCGAELPSGASYCSACGAPLISSVVQSPVWNLSFYRIRIKVLAVARQFWIEDEDSNSLGYSRQKVLALKTAIQVYSDERMTQELFMVKQEQYALNWGIFDVFDSQTNVCLGRLRRKGRSDFGSDQYSILNPAGQEIGTVKEGSRRGIARRYVPYANLAPERTTVEMYGREVATINQRFKMIGNVWELNCTDLPREVDRRVLLAFMIVVATVGLHRPGLRVG